MPGAGELLRQARHEAGLSQRALAEAAGTSGPTIAAYEKGTKRPRADVLLRLLRETGHQLALDAASTKADRFARLMNLRIADLVRENPGLIDEALDLLDSGHYRSSYRDVWAGILRAGPAAVIGVLTSTDESLQPLQSDDPFSLLGIIEPEDRREMLALAYG